MITLLHGDARDVLATLPAGSVQCIVTSPPYYGLRKYSSDPREIGGEPTPAAYVAALVGVFREVWRVLRDDGTCWINLGDSYAGAGYSNQTNTGGARRENGAKQHYTHRHPMPGVKQKDMLGMPWRVAFALQDAGWILRTDIIWSKPNPMPESVRDRPTRAHEYVFLFAKRQRYYYDATAIAEAATQPIGIAAHTGQHKSIIVGHNGRATSKLGTNQGAPTRNRRSVWTIATQPYAGAHFATMPEALIEPCILAGSASQACETCGAAWGREYEPTGHVNKREPAHVPGNTATKTDSTGWAPTSRPTDRFSPRCACATNTGSARSVVLDPFLGSGTVAKVAERFGRDSIGIDLNAEYLELQESRTDGVQVELFR